MNAVIDFGNTQAKLGIFEQNQLTQIETFSSDHELGACLKQKKIAHLIVSNVGKSRMLFVNELKKHFQVVEFTHQTPIPIMNNYGTPESLGMDRLAGVIGATVLFPDKANLVIDIGTCITYDFITLEKEYLGGGISPGMRLRNLAMNNYTANLPLVEDFTNIELLGKSTVACLKSGIVHGITFEIEGLIAAYQKSFGIFNTVLCGGDAIFFESKLKASIFVRQEIVLLGLHEVLREIIASTHQ
ncbi:MAG: type III pantothenate kinase [Flammeovirgaceae bacterium]